MEDLPKDLRIAELYTNNQILAHRRYNNEKTGIADGSCSDGGVCVIEWRIELA